MEQTSLLWYQGDCFAPATSEFIPFSPEPHADGHALFDEGQFGPQGTGFGDLPVLKGPNVQQGTVIGIWATEHHILWISLDLCPTQ